MAGDNNLPRVADPHAPCVRCRKNPVMVRVDSDLDLSGVCDDSDLHSFVDKCVGDEIKVVGPGGNREVLPLKTAHDAAKVRWGWAVGFGFCAAAADED